MHLTMAEITAWLGSFLWPFFRIGALFMVAPITGSNNVPVRVRLMLALAMTVLVMPTLHSVPQVTPFSLAAITIILHQLLIGAAMGFVVMLVFAVIVTGGQMIAMQMGLGFASMVDPQNGTQVPVLSQLYIIMTTLLFLGMNGHLILIRLLADSFDLLPISNSGISAYALHAIADWGTQMFAGALWMALPAVASLLLVNISFGVMARSAPQLNIFAIGFPVAMIMGFLVILYSLSTVAPQFTQILENGFDLIRLLLRGEG